MGIFNDLAECVGSIVGTVLGIPLGIAASSLGVSEKMIQKAIDAGCETMEEVKDFLDID